MNLLSTIQVCLVFLVIFSIIVLVRNVQIYKFRMGLLKRVSRFAQQDVKAGQSWRWRYDMFSAVSYNEMIFKFWRSPESFYNLEKLFKLPTFKREETK